MSTDTLRTFHTARMTVTENTVDAVISTSNLARDNAVIEAAGWDFSHFRENPVVLWSHQDFPGRGAREDSAGSGMPIARADHIVTEGTDVVAKGITFDTEDAFAMQVLGKIERGFVNATSVRWRPTKTSTRKETVDGKEREILVFEKQELLEFSFVSIPADPGALIQRDNGEPIDIQEVIADARHRADKEQLTETITLAIRDGVSRCVCGDPACPGFPNHTLEENYPTLADDALALFDRVIDADRLDDSEVESLEGLYLELTERLHPVSPKPPAISKDELREIFKPLGVTEMIAAAFAKRTGRPIDQIRKELGDKHG